MTNPQSVLRQTRGADKCERATATSTPPEKSRTTFFGDFGIKFRLHELKLEAFARLTCASSCSVMVRAVVAIGISYSS
jgi:hypothetical protein